MVPEGLCGGRGISDDDFLYSRTVALFDPVKVIEDGRVYYIVVVIISYRNAWLMIWLQFENRLQRVYGESQSPLADHVLQFCCDSLKTLMLWVFKLQPYISLPCI